MEVRVSTLPERMDEAEVLDRAAELIAEHGWRQLSASGARGLTVGEALNRAILQRYDTVSELGMPARRQIVGERMDAEQVLACWLLDSGTVPGRWGQRFPYDHIVMEWSERAGQDGDQVLRALRVAAGTGTQVSIY
jgi:hypothetical protein